MINYLTSTLSRSEHEKTNSLEWSSLINKAYNVLSAPIKRAEYMLELHDVHVPEENTSDDPELLLDIMEKNEDVENCETKEELNEVLEEMQETISKMYEIFENYLKDENLEHSRNILIKMRYYTSIENNIKAKLYNFTGNKIKK